MNGPAYHTLLYYCMVYYDYDSNIILHSLLQCFTDQHRIVYHLFSGSTPNNRLNFSFPSRVENPTEWHNAKKNSYEADLLTSSYPRC